MLPNEKLTYSREILRGHARDCREIVAGRGEERKVLVELELGQPGVHDVEVGRPVRMAAQRADRAAGRGGEGAGAAGPEVVPRGTARVQRGRRVPGARARARAARAVPARALRHVDTCVGVQDVS